MASKRKRTDLCVSDKVLILKELEKKTTQTSIAKSFGISQAFDKELCPDTVYKLESQVTSALVKNVSQKTIEIFFKKL